jgi:acyl carrier protein
MSRQDILETVRRFIAEVIGEDWALEVEITEATAFNEDLELESIEFVALAEQIQAHYGEQINFIDWLAEMDLDQIIALQVGDLVGFIDSCLS